MSNTFAPRSPLALGLTYGPVLASAAALAILVLVVGPSWGLQPRLHAPDLGLIARQTPVLQLHILAACLALLIGLVLLVGEKGSGLHRTLGWLWAVAMATVAISSIFIRDINGGVFSWIHLLTGWTLIILPMGLYAARRHRVAAHRRHMTGLFVGALVIAGMFTFLPGRLMWRVFLG